jgi:RNA polymerase sigma-70 factor (ECF subfamily)
MMKAMNDSSAHDAEARPGAAAPALSAVVVDALVANRARFLTFLERRVGGRDAAEEVLQEAFARVLSRGAGARLRDDAAAVAWFYRLLRNAIVDRSRRASAEGRTLARLQASDAGGDSATDRAVAGESCPCLAGLLSTLRPAHERALRSVELAEARLGDFAATEGITPGHAAVRVHRARQALRRRLEERCGACATHGCRDCACGAPRARGGGRAPAVRAAGPRRASARGT